MLKTAFGSVLLKIFIERNASFVERNALFSEKMKKVVLKFG